MTSSRTPDDAEGLDGPQGSFSAPRAVPCHAGYDQLPLPAMLLDRQGLLVHVKRRWIELFDHPVQEAVGKPFESFLEPDWIPHFRANLPTVHRTGRLEGLQLEVLRRDGAPAFVELFATVCGDPLHGDGLIHCLL